MTADRPGHDGEVCGVQTEGVMGLVLVCEQVAGHVGPHVQGRTYWDAAVAARPAGHDEACGNCEGIDPESCIVCGFDRAEHEGDGEMVHDFAPSAPVADQAREDIARAIEASDQAGLMAALADELGGVDDPYGRNADAVLATATLRRLRDAEAAVERVRAWAAMNDDMAREYDEAADAVTDSALVFGARERAEDCRAVADGVRRALDGTASPANRPVSPENGPGGIRTGIGDTETVRGDSAGPTSSEETN